MYTHIDWISFSFAVTPPDGAGEGELVRNIETGLIDLHPDLPSMLALDAGMEAGKGRAPYTVSWTAPASKITLFASPRLPHALIEITGQGCDFLRGAGVLDDVLRVTRAHVTRVDLAVDMETDTRPHAFAEMRDVARFKSHSQFTSESGETYYVGSRTSDRYARVYRYNPPHERAHLLRCEFVLKAENAKSFAEEAWSGDLETLAEQLGNSFGWTHPDWQPDSITGSKMSTYRPERREGKTMVWLNKTVAPVLRRLQNDGILDVVDWLNRHVLGSVEDDHPF